VELPAGVLRRLSRRNLQYRVPERALVRLLERAPPDCSLFASLVLLDCTGFRIYHVPQDETIVLRFLITYLSQAVVVTQLPGAEQVFQGQQWTKQRRALRRVYCRIHSLTVPLLCHLVAADAHRKVSVSYPRTTMLLHPHHGPNSRLFSFQLELLVQGLDLLPY